MSNDSQYLEQLVTGVGGVAGSLILTPMAGTWGMMIGAGIGSSLALIVIKNSDYLTTLHKELRTEWIVKRLIRGKLNADFTDSFLSDTASATSALLDAKNIINKAQERMTARRRDRRFDCEESIVVPEGALSERTIRAHLKALRKYRKRIKVSCTAVCAATIAALKSLQKKYGDEEAYGDCALKLEIDFSPCNGRDQVSKIVKDDSFDFLVVPNDPFFFADYAKTNSYKLLLTCHGAEQYLFIRKGVKYLRTTQVHVLVESSAELHFMYHPFVPRGAKVKRNGILEAEEIPSLIENMAGGDCILAWSPLSNYLSRNPAYELVKNTGHHIYYCLRCHERWKKARANRARAAFIALFTDEWRFCNARRRRAYGLLADDQRYVQCFATGLGIKLSS